jgi:acyl dehydratase
MGEELPIYEREGLIPPGHHLSTANHLLSANVRLGPWIHASSEVRHLGPAHQGEALRMRGRVAGLQQRRGHRLVELDALLVGADLRPDATVRHTAIYEPARRDS